MPRSIPAATWLATLCFAATLLAGSVAAAQENPPEAAPAAARPPAAPPHRGVGGPRVAHTSGNPFSVLSWASFDAQGPSLIRAPSAPGSMDLATRDEDDTYVTVYARKKGFDRDLHARLDGTEPGQNAASIPWSLPESPPTDCANEAYSTIGGQPATGADMIGSMGGGRC